MNQAPQDPAPRPERQRPSYGLPGPVAPAEPAPSSAPAAGAPAPAPGSAPAASPAGRRRRRGLIPLITGLVLLFLVAPALFIGGIVWAMGSLVSEVGSGPTPLGGATSEVELKADQMIVVYAPAADAGASCTATAKGGGNLTTVPSSGRVSFGDGQDYDQKLGVVALEDTTATITCTGTDAPVRVGPLSIFEFAGPLLLGPVIGLFVGLIGLVTAIVGLVLLLRSRRA